MPSEGGSTRWEQVEALVRRLEPRIIERFQHYQVPPSEAGVMLEEVVTLLLYRWTEVARPEAWMLEIIEYRLQRKAAQDRERALDLEDLDFDLDLDPNREDA